MTKRTCPHCEIYNQLELKRERDRIKKELVLLRCDHGGIKRFILHGPSPQTPHKFDLLVVDLKVGFELTKKRGAKSKKPTYLRINRHNLSRESANAELISPMKGAFMSEIDNKTYGALLPLEEGAEWLGVSVHTLRQKAQLGLVETHKLFGKRLISEDEIVRLIEESRQPARARVAA